MRKSMQCKKKYHGRTDVVVVVVVVVAAAAAIEEG
jgi:hypothetical protein